MAKNITTTGNYNAPNGQQVGFSFEYLQFESLQEAVSVLGEGEVLALIQRMVKVDAGNTAREKAKVANGHSARKPQTEEEKASAKAKRQADKALLDLIKAKGIDLDQLQGLIG